jgi:hypothetical protein
MIHRITSPSVDPLVDFRILAYSHIVTDAFAVVRHLAVKVHEAHHFTQTYLADPDRHP